MENLRLFLCGRRKWEYLDYFFGYDRPAEFHDDAIRELGEQGWEMISIQHNTALFKRPK